MPRLLAWVLLAALVGFDADCSALRVSSRSWLDVVLAARTVPVCADFTIAQLQGRGPSSPYDGRTRLNCLAGCVTGVSTDGFYLQSVVPDDAPDTSEGIFVYRWDGWFNPRKLRRGDLLEIYNFDVQEFYGSTEIVGLSGDTNASYRRVGACSLPTPVSIPPLTDPRADPEATYERFENMRVIMTFDGSAVGPTTRYPVRSQAGQGPGQLSVPEIAVVDRQSPFYGRRVFVGDLPFSSGGGMVHLSGRLGYELPDLGTGDGIAARGLTGVLAYQFGRYVLLVDPDAPSVTVADVPAVLDSEEPIGPDEFAVCTFNVENLFDAVDDGDGDMGDWAPADTREFARLLQKIASAIRGDLQACTIVGLQEVEGKDATWAALAAAVGPSFRYDYYESADERDITVGILYDANRVRLRHSRQVQACGSTDYGVSYAWARGARAYSNPCRLGSYPLFDRPPYVADLNVRSAQGDRSLDVRIVVNHFKSKLGDETVNSPQRIAQAQHVASLVATLRAVALGDLNDPLGSPTLAQFTRLVNLFEAHLPHRDHYTYIYNGLSQVFDHFLMTPGLDRYFKSGGPVHINADFPDLREPDATSRRSSDHDPVFVRFGFRPLVPIGESEALPKDVPRATREVQAR